MAYCLNMCEITDFTASAEDIKELIESLTKQAGFDFEKRIYFGSYFCSQYFLKINAGKLSEVMRLMSDDSFRVTLVVPVFSQKDFELGNKKVKDIAEMMQGVVDEITVNDIGMLKTVSGFNNALSINYGRLFFKDPRDIRLKESVMRITQPAMLGSISADINGYAELDSVSEIIDVPESFEKKVCLHSPYCYMSYGNICKFASIHKDASEKFRPNSPCNEECLHIFERIYDPNLPERGEILKFGRTLYFKQLNCKIINSDPQRVIYFPLDEWIKMKGYYTDNDEHTDAAE